MARWFRVYDDLVDDPKVQRLSSDLFRALVNLWCLASKTGGTLPSVDEIAFKLRTPLPKTRRILAELRAAGLIDGDEAALHPHNWEARQFKSDVSNERVKRYRERKRNVTGNGSGTPPDTETDTEEAETEELIKYHSSKTPRESEACRPFPKDGSIAYASGPWAEIARRRGRGADVDVLASAFRKFCHEHDIAFDDSAIVQKFDTFCGRHRIRGLHA